MTWPVFPKRLRSALKALSCLAAADGAMQSQAIAERIGVPKAETAKIMQLLVWGGFVGSQRGTKGGFHLAADPGSVTMGDIIDFFLSRHPEDIEDNFPVIAALQQALAPCQQRFAEMTLADLRVMAGKEPPNKRVRSTKTVSRRNSHKTVVAQR